MAVTKSQNQKDEAIVAKGSVYVLDWGATQNCKMAIKGWFLTSINNRDWGVLMNSNYMDKDQRKAFESYVRRFHPSNSNWQAIITQREETKNNRRLKLYAKMGGTTR